MQKTIEYFNFGAQSEKRIGDYVCRRVDGRMELS